MNWHNLVEFKIHNYSFSFNGTNYRIFNIPETLAISNKITIPENAKRKGAHIKSFTGTFENRRPIDPLRGPK